jgi:hypothetical protein
MKYPSSSSWKCIPGWRTTVVEVVAAALQVLQVLRAQLVLQVLRVKTEPVVLRVLMEWTPLIVVDGLLIVMRLLAQIQV